MAISFAPQSKKWYRDQGYAVFDAESIWRIPGGLPRRHDLFGFVDLVAIKPGEMVMVQVSAWSGVGAHLTKIRTQKDGQGQWAIPMVDVARWLLALGVKIELQGWKLDGHKYVNKIVSLTPEMLG